MLDSNDYLNNNEGRKMGKIGETRKYWLLKSEPGDFSIDDLAKSPKQTAHWDGVRNYQARNLLRDEIKKGDLALFYHSNASPPAVVGVMKIARSGYVDHTAFDIREKHYDPKSDPENPRWFMVDVKFQRKFAHQVSLPEIKNMAELATMMVARRGSRLSVQPVTPGEWKLIHKLAGEKI